MANISIHMANILEKMYNQNPWWSNHTLISEDTHIKDLTKFRYVFLNEEFLQHNFADGVYIATGPRQIGKTTHLKLLVKNTINNTNKENFLYFNCDILADKSEIVEVVETYLNNFKPVGRMYIMLDEITSVKDGILAVKYLVDQGIKKNITYIITGSSTVNIKKTGEYLPGRRGHGRNFIFSPVSFSDFIQKQYPDEYHEYQIGASLERYYIELKQKIPLVKELDVYLICGGIPRVINTYLEHNELTLDSLTLYRDWVISETAKNGKREQIIKIILERILLCIGSDVSNNSLSSDTGISSHNTVYDYLDFLEDAFIIKHVCNYEYHQKKIQLRKNKKIYLNDAFLFWLFSWWINGDSMCYKELAKNSILKSSIIENICFIHLSRIFGDIYFYRDTDEIDFIHKNFAFESKYQHRISRSDFKALLKFPGKRMVISKSHLVLEKEYTILPVELFLLLSKSALVEI